MQVTFGISAPREEESELQNFLTGVVSQLSPLARSHMTITKDKKSGREQVGGGEARSQQHRSTLDHRRLKATDRVGLLATGKIGSQQSR